MSVFSVHQPPVRAGEKADPQRFVFVRDGFHFWAFLLGPLWMLFNRLWLVTFLYFLVLATMETTFWLLGVTGFPDVFAGFLLAVLIGLEAGSLKRWTLNRRGWKMIGNVVGHDIEDAERRFFETWLEKAGEAAPVPAPKVSPPSAPAPAPRVMSATGQSDVIGLFPEPGAR